MDRQSHRLNELAAAVGRLLKDAKETVAVAESSAGGLISAALLAVPGASAYYVGGAVVYTPKARAALLAVAKEDMAGMRAATEAYARLIARKMRDSLGTTWAVCETGATGPSGNRYGDAPGHACFAVSGPVGLSVTLETGSADREANMAAFARRGLELLDAAIRSARSRP